MLFRSRQTASLEELYTLTKTRTYAHARVRRLALYALLGLREENRLDIELRPVSGGGQGENLDIPGQSCEMKRSAVITAHGAAGAALLEALRPVLSSRFAVRGA